MNARQRESEERNVDLQEHGCTAYDVDVNGPDGAEDANLGHAHEREHEANGDGQRECDEHDSYGHEEPVQHNRQARYQNGWIEEQAQELVGVPCLNPRLLFEVMSELLGWGCNGYGDVGDVVNMT